MSTEHLDELRRRLAEQTDQDSTDDRVTTDRLAGMRRRLSELEHISKTPSMKLRRCPRRTRCTRSWTAWRTCASCAPPTTA